MTLFSGLSAFPLTPTDAQGQMIPHLLEKHLARIRQAGADSIGLLGSTGNYAYLLPEERKRIVEATANILDGSIPFVVGVGAIRTDIAKDLARHAKASGADGLLLAPVSYQKLTDQEVFDHFVEVAAAGDLPLCIYSNPGTTNFTFSHDLIRRLSEIPNIKSVKLPLPRDGDFKAELDQLRSVTRDGFSVGYSGDWGMKEALLAGSDCWFSAIGGILPEAVVSLANAARMGDVARADMLDETFGALWELMKEFGSLRIAYAVCEYRDEAGIAPIRPVQPLPAAVQEKVRAALGPLGIKAKA